MGGAPDAGPVDKPRRQRGTRLAGGGLAALVLAAPLLWWLRPPPDDTAPYPRWRNGIIVEVRNCAAPPDEERLLRCAALYCAQRTTLRLTNAQQATLSIERYARDPSDGLIHVSGRLAQYLRAPTLPTGFTCTMRDYRHAEPAFVFGRRGDGEHTPQWSN